MLIIAEEGLEVAQMLDERPVAREDAGIAEVVEDAVREVMVVSAMG